MRHFTLLFLLSLTLGFAYSQAPQGNRPGFPGGAVPNMGHIYGKIIDADGKGISDVSVMLMQTQMDTVTKKAKQVLLKAVVTKNNGVFNFEELPVRGRLKLQMSRSGYAPIEKDVSFFTPPAPGAPKPAAPPAMPSFDKDLGNLSMTVDAKQLQAVTVTSTTSNVKLNGDKKVFNVEKNIMSTGGTGVDVMRNVPSANVDIDGNVTIRNAAPQILVDGRPTTLTLEQIPADVIESVEVITNPSAKYDASGGGGGILNIVLKKNKKTGYNGNLRAGVDKRGGVNAGADLNLRQNKFNFNASGNLNQNRGRTWGTTDRRNLNDTPQTSIFQNNYNKTRGQFIFGKVGIDYFATPRTTFSLSGIRVHGEFKPWEDIDINTDSLYTSGKVTTSSERLTRGSRQFDGKGLVFGFKQLFPKEGQELTIDANYFGGKNEGQSDFTTNYFANSGNNVAGKTLERQTGFGTDRNFVVQTDLVLPVSKSIKVETGLRAAIRSRENNNANYNFDFLSNGYVLIPTSVSNYKNTDNVYAAYATMSNSFKDFSYKLGLRAESSDYNGELINTGEKFNNKYPVSLFPSVFLSQKLANKQDLQVSYTRRINRPNFFQLIPFIDYTDKLNITRGNPALRPEFTQALEMSYLKTFTGNNTFLASVYYKYTNNLITRFQDELYNPVTNTNDLINTFINANSSYAIGSELTSQNYLTKWWDISTNVNIYNSKINTDNISVTGSQEALWSWFGKFNSNFRLPKEFAIQFTTTYQSKTNLPVNSNQNMGGPPMMQSQSASQGYIKASWGMDLALKKTFLKSKALAATLSISDIFRTRINSQYSESEYFIQDYYRLRDPQMVRLNLSYRFGKIDASLFKRKSFRGEQNATESMQ